MSQISSQIDPELDVLLGGPVQEEAHDETENADLAIAVLIRKMRDEILIAAQEVDVGVRELARRLGVSPSAVSRHLRSEGDLRVSTAALFADALGYEWHIALHPAVKPGSNARSHIPVGPRGVVGAQTVPMGATAAPASGFTSTTLPSSVLGTNSRPLSGLIGDSQLPSVPPSKTAIYGSGLPLAKLTVD